MTGIFIYGTAGACHDSATCCNQFSAPFVCKFGATRQNSRWCSFAYRILAQVPNIFPTIWAINDALLNRVTDGEDIGRRWFRCSKSSQSYILQVATTNSRMGWAISIIAHRCICQDGSVFAAVGSWWSDAPSYWYFDRENALLMKWWSISFDKFPKLKIVFWTHHHQWCRWLNVVTGQNVAATVPAAFIV